MATRVMHGRREGQVKETGKLVELSAIVNSGTCQGVIGLPAALLTKSKF